MSKVKQSGLNQRSPAHSGKVKPKKLIGGRVKTLLFLKNHKALTFTSQGFAMSKSCCNFRP